MRPVGRGEFESLYFTYPEFEPPTSISREDRHRVAIVGAGPVGLTAALVLAREGVQCVVLERKNTFNDGSRAICIARQSYHILSRLGLEKRFVEKALGWTTGQSFYRGQKVLEFKMPHDGDQRFMPMYNLQQQYIEQYLYEAAVAHPLIEIRWQSEVVQISPHSDSVTLDIRDPKRSYEIEAAWVLAADGARSSIRKMLNLRLQGANYEGRYVIADVKMKHDFPTIRRALFDPTSRPGGTVLIHRQPDDIWRIDYQLEKHEDPEVAVAEESVRSCVGAVLKEIGHTGPWELEWWSIYTASTLALDNYRHGRVFFIGDSAHVVPIFGVRGLNNGLADAENIGWKLALVEKGLAPSALLDSYSPERRGATLDVFAQASKSTRFMTPPSKGWQVVRDAALSLSLRYDFTRQFINPRQMTPYTYSESPVTIKDEDDFASGPIPGEVMHDVAIGGGFLSQRIGLGFTLMVFGNHAGLESLENNNPYLKVLVVGGPDVPDPEGKIAARYGATSGSAYLIRPDMHVAGRWKVANVEKVRRALSHYLEPVEETVA